MEQAPEFFCSDDSRESGYTDKPAPGKGYLAGLILLLGMVLYLFYRFQPDFSSGSAIMITVGLTLLTVMLLSLIAASYRTAYKIADRKLVVRCWIFKYTIALSDIIDTEVSRFISQPVLWNIVQKKRHLCNRFTDVVRLTTNGGTLLISPGDPEIFIEQLRANRP